MARVTQPEVEQVISVQDCFDLTPFITAATSLVDWLETCTSLLTTAQLKSIELFLVAHFYSSYDQRVQSERAGDASATYQGKTDMYLDGTQYGQAAIAMDISGCLARHNQELKDGTKRVPQMVWLGKVPSEQVHVWDRD